MHYVYVIRLIYYEAYLKQADALSRERYLKSGAGRRFLKSRLKRYLRRHPSKEAPQAQLLRGSIRTC
jgi:predicted GIY-YIG superfamily endonuclease